MHAINLCGHFVPACFAIVLVYIQVGPAYEQEKIISNWPNFRLSRQVSITERRDEVLRDFGFSMNSDYIFIFGQSGTHMCGMFGDFQYRAVETYLNLSLGSLGARPPMSATYLTMALD